MLSSLFILLFSLGCIMSLTGIHWGKTLVRDDRSGLDVALVFDVSKSMLAHDISPSRFARSKQVARTLIEKSVTNRTSITAFRGEGVTVLPATEDTTALLQFLDAMNIDVVTTPGTNIADGIRAAMDGFPEQVESNQVIVLFSDGEHHAGNLEAVAAEAAERRIRIISLGVGTEAGSSIKLANDQEITNSKGETVVTRLEKRRLEMLARESGGVFLNAGAPGVEAKILARIKNIAASGGELGFRFEEKNRYRFFLLFALLFLTGYIVTGVIRWGDTV
jgi:Ca-activated chloride channel family protein